MRGRTGLAEFPAVDWFCIQDGKKLGPFSESSLRQRIGTGEITPDTWVWRPGQEEWQPLRVAWSGQVSLPAHDARAATVPTRCVLCEGMFATEDMIQIDGRSVCAGCKPVLLQQLKEGVPPPNSEIAWRSGKWVVTFRRASLGRCCVRCGQVADAPAKSFAGYWIPGSSLLVPGGIIACAVALRLILETASYWVLFLGISLGVVAQLLMAVLWGKRFHVSASLCADDRRRAKLRKWAGFAVFIVGSLFFGFGIATASWSAGLFGLVVLISGIQLDSNAGRSLMPVKADETHVWLKGAGKPFLDRLPEWPGK